VRTFDIEGQPVRCIETDDGERTWLCDCDSFKAREKRMGDTSGGCGHVVVAIWKCIEEGSIDVR
jgi:hypothetical protein